jgi:hypothetical protein
MSQFELKLVSKQNWSLEQKQNVENPISQFLTSSFHRKRGKINMLIID